MKEVLAVEDWGGGVAMGTADLFSVKCQQAPQLADVLCITTTVVCQGGGGILYLHLSGAPGRSHGGRDGQLLFDGQYSSLFIATRTRPKLLVFIHSQTRTALSLERR